MRLFSEMLVVVGFVVTWQFALCGASSLGEELDSRVAANKTFVIADGLTATTFADETQLFNPASIDVDDKGRVWVCETVNYRKNTRKAGDRILILEDSNGDGQVDCEKVFYQGHDIDGGHGVCVLGNRAIVSAPDKILILTDTDGDLKADTKKVLFRGKVLNPKQGQHDHAIHAVMFGPDGRLYFNFGNFNAHLHDSADEVVRDIEGRAIDNSRQPFQEGMVLRCELDGSNLEVLGHNFRNNWEVTVDSFGVLWQSDNDNGSSSCRVNFVMEHGNFGYRDEMTGAAYQTDRTNIETTMQRQMWHQNDPGVVPNLLITGAGAPTGILVYEGTLLPEEYHGQMLLAEPARNVVWSIPVQKNGAGYKAKKVDVLATLKSQSYRPSDVSVAPDGSLIVADWFDPIVCCHETRDDRGRLFRVAPKGHKYALPHFDYTTAEGAVAALRNPNLAVRYKAWTALNMMQERAREPLGILAADNDPRLRARALWLLAAIKGNASATVQQASRDKSEDVRATALRIARRHQLALVPLVMQLVRDPSSVVRRECALTLRGSNAIQAAKLWAELAIQYDGHDRWYLEALGIGAQGHDANCLKVWLTKVGDDWREKAGRDIVWRSRAPKAASSIATLVLDPKVPVAEHPRLMRALDFHHGVAKEQAIRRIVLGDKGTGVAFALLEAIKRLPDEAVTNSPALRNRIEEALRQTTDTSTMLRLARRFQIKSLSEQILRVTMSEEPMHLKVAAVRLLLEFGEEKRVVRVASESLAVIDALGFAGTNESIEVLTQMALNKEWTTERRTSAVTALSGISNGQHALRRLIAQEKLPSQLDAIGSQLLYRSTSPQLRKFAAEHLKLPVASEKDALRSLTKLLATTPHPLKGPAVFVKAGCGKCHVIDGKGVEFGPDLSAIGSVMTRRELLVSILAPSAIIKFGYENFNVVLHDGRIINGYRTSESQTKMSIRTNGGVQNEILKADIDKLIPSKVSLMPTGLEKAITQQELVDLVDWLTKRKPNEPAKHR